MQIVVDAVRIAKLVAVVHSTEDDNHQHTLVELLEAVSSEELIEFSCRDGTNSVEPRRDPCGFP